MTQTHDTYCSGDECQQCDGPSVDHSMGRGPSIFDGGPSTDIRRDVPIAPGAVHTEFGNQFVTVRTSPLTHLIPS